MIILNFNNKKYLSKIQTIQKKYRQKIIQLHKLAKFGKIASGIFHDLVNPLTAIILHTEYIKKKHSGSSTEINTDIENLKNNVIHVKNFTKAVGRQIQDKDTLVIFMADAEVALALQMLSHKARKYDIEFRISPTNISLQIYGNPIKFYRVISELVSNAIDSYKNSNKQDKSITITYSKDDTGICIIICDYGCGIKKKNLNKIFKPFFTTKEIDNGTGIGLSICKEIIEKDFNGNIKVHSKINIGTSFTVTLQTQIPVFNTT